MRKKVRKRRSAIYWWGSNQRKWVVVLTHSGGCRRAGTDWCGAGTKAVVLRGRVTKQPLSCTLAHVTAELAWAFSILLFTVFRYIFWYITLYFNTNFGSLHLVILIIRIKILFIFIGISPFVYIYLVDSFPLHFLLKFLNKDILYYKQYF